MRPIDADALEYYLCTNCDWHDTCGATCWAVRTIRLQETVEVEPVRYGRWIDKGDYAVCTECGGQSGTQYDGVEPIPLMTQFCPNCGARMDKKEEPEMSKVELLKELDPKKVEAWDKLHDKRKVYRCERCGAEWKCEYKYNILGKSHEYNGDPDILCQCCGFPTVKEVGEYDKYSKDPPKSCVMCKYFNGWTDPSGCERTPGHVVAVSNPRQYRCDDFSRKTFCSNY